MDENEQFLIELKKRVCDKIDSKFRRGVKEHGGYLWRKPVDEYIQDEITDLIVYGTIIEMQKEKGITPDLKDKK